MHKIVRCGALLCAIVMVNSMEKTQMYMKRSKVSDQSMSGSGYSYNIHDASPKEYSFETDDESKAIKILKELGYDPYAEVSRYAIEHEPLPFEHYYKEYSQVGDEKPLDFDVNNKHYNYPDYKLQSYGSHLYSPLDEYEKITYPPLYYKHPYAHGYGHDSHHLGNFLKKGGKYYDEDKFSKKGEKFDSGYKKVDAFEKGLKGDYGKKGSKSYYDQHGGRKHSDYDVGNNYATNNAASKSNFGESFGQDKGHNKGSKTTGYHKVYHKDDYNKQHKFYDKADKKGHFSKYGDYDAKNGNEKGYFVKGGSSDNGFDSKDYGTKGVSDHGKFEDVAEGFRSADGREGFHNDYAKFGKEGGKESGSEEGYSI